MLVRELQLLSVHEVIIRWIRSFNLTGRVQRVRPWRDPTRNEISSISFCDPSTNLCGGWRNRLKFIC